MSQGDPVIARLEERITGHDREIRGLRADIDAKHRENRASIHALRNSQQETLDILHKIELKLAKFSGYAMGAGAIVALFLKILDKVWK